MPPPDGTAMPVSEQDVAKGTALAMVARFGAVIEIVAQPVYTALFGLATYGLYITLLSAVTIFSNIAELGATSGLQRLVPQAKDAATAHAHVKISWLSALSVSTAMALLITLFSPQVARALNAAPQDLPHLVAGVRLFAWGIPLWTSIEVCSAAMRARRAFGPEIRLKIFYEQLSRLAFALGAFGLGIHSLGLVIAHLCSMLLIALLSLRLLCRYYDAGLLRHTDMSLPLIRENLATSLALLPATLIKNSFGDLPAVALNMLLPGSSGATAAAVYAICRKISSVLQMVRLSFSYVMSPLASAQAGNVSIAAVAPLYAYATRLATVGIIPITVVLLALGPALLSVFGVATYVGYPVLVILVLGRSLEALSGPGEAILEVIGARSRSAINSIIGFALAIVLGFWLAPKYGAIGMALAVSIGLVTISYVAAIQLLLSHQLHPMTWSLGRAVTGGIAGGALVGLGCLGISHFGDRYTAATALILFAPALWLAAKTGLPLADRAVLGRVGRSLKLA